VPRRDLLPTAQLRTAPYQHAFSPARTSRADPETSRVLAWVQQASLLITRLADRRYSDGRVTETEGICHRDFLASTRLDLAPFCNPDD
jgi:hypothetical protein